MAAQQPERDAASCNVGFVASWRPSGPHRSLHFAPPRLQLLEFRLHTRSSSVAADGLRTRRRRLLRDHLLPPCAAGGLPGQTEAVALQLGVGDRHRCAFDGGLLLISVLIHMVFFRGKFRHISSSSDSDDDGEMQPPNLTGDHITESVLTLGCLAVGAVLTVATMAMVLQLQQTLADTSAALSL